jgi:hypothetical protein
MENRKWQNENDYGIARPCTSYSENPTGSPGVACNLKELLLLLLLLMVCLLTNFTCLPQMLQTSFTAVSQLFTFHRNLPPKIVYSLKIHHHTKLHMLLVAPVSLLPCLYGCQTGITDSRNLNYKMKSPLVACYSYQLSRKCITRFKSNWGGDSK